AFSVAAISQATGGANTVQRIVGQQGRREPKHDRKRGRQPSAESSDPGRPRARSDERGGVYFHQGISFPRVRVESSLVISIIRPSRRSYKTSLRREGSRAESRAARLRSATTRSHAAED